MLVASVVVIGVLLVVALALAMARRRDADTAIGVLDRETRHEDRGVLVAAAPMTGREVERQAAAERRGGTLVLAPPPPPPLLAQPPRPMDEEALGVTRRQFLNGAILTLTGLSVAGFGAAVLGFLWPVLEAGGFGSVIAAGEVTTIVASITGSATPFYVANARAYVHQYPAIDLKNATNSGAYADPILAGFGLGFGALYQKCPHLGCRVPWCQSSQWFECPCHGSQYNRVGEKKGGPAPRGMDRFAISISAGNMSINTGVVYEGPPIGTNTTGQEAQGPHCV
jgi:cytochrome b6-f complex iron-sulfur subunit